MSEVPSRLVPCSPITSQAFAAQGLSRVSMWPISLTPLTAAVRTLNVSNVSSSSRPGGLLFHAGSLPHRPLSPSFFSEQMPSDFRSVPGVYLGSCLHSFDVLSAALPPCLDFSIVDTFAYSRVISEHFYPARFRSHVFRGGGVSTARTPGNDFALLGCIVVVVCCLSHSAYWLPT